MNVAEICNLLENVVNAHDPRDTAYEIMCQLERSAEAPKRGGLHGFEEENRLIRFSSEKIADHA